MPRKQKYNHFESALLARLGRKDTYNQQELIYINGARRMNEGE